MADGDTSRDGFGDDAVRLDLEPDAVISCTCFSVACSGVETLRYAKVLAIALPARKRCPQCVEACLWTGLWLLGVLNRALLRTGVPARPAIIGLTCEEGGELIGSLSIQLFLEEAVDFGQAYIGENDQYLGDVSDPGQTGVRIHGSSGWKSSNGLGNHVLSLVLGFVGGWAYHRYRLLKIKRYAPSAKVVSFHVALKQHHYNRLPKKEDDVMYSIVDENDPKGSDREQ